MNKLYNKISKNVVAIAAIFVLVISGFVFSNSSYANAETSNQAKGSVSELKCANRVNNIFDCDYTLHTTHFPYWSDELDFITPMYDYNSQKQSSRNEGYMNYFVPLEGSDQYINTDCGENNFSDINDIELQNDWIGIESDLTETKPYCDFHFAIDADKMHFVKEDLKELQIKSGFDDSTVKFDINYGMAKL
ncbi:MAG: hypothetical protein LBM13_03730 [Candidatus Ancillula sp.]|jgi:hypothetical protein|nr:hypothetical protein [Candidatus Ancillula sp.]